MHQIKEHKSQNRKETNHKEEIPFLEGCSSPKNVDDANDVLTANRTLVHLLSAQGTRHHVSAVQQYTVDLRVHANAAQFVVWKL